MFIPYQVDVPMERWPIANFVIIAFTIIMSLSLLGPLHDWQEDATVTVAASQGTVTLEKSPPEGELNYFLLQPNHFNPLQLVGSLFLHEGILHLLGNMLFLWVFGNAVNAKLGQWKYVLFYLGSGICEGLVWLAIGPRVPSLGASGAIMGVVGAMFVLYPVNEVSIFYFYWLATIYTGVWKISAWWLIAAYFVLDVWGALFQSNEGIGYLSHVAGFLAGALGAAALLRWGVIEMDRGEKSLLQSLGWMPHEEMPAHGMAIGVGKGPVVPKPRVIPPPRKPRDTGPISLD